MDCSPPGSSVQGISQTRTLEQVAISFFRGTSWPKDWTHISCIELISPALASEFLTTQPPKQPWPGNYPFCYNNTWLSQIGDTENIPSWKNEVLFLHLFDDTQQKNDKDVFIYKYYNLLKILHSWVFLLEFKPFYSGKVSGWKGKSHGQYSLFFYWLTVSS